MKPGTLLVLLTALLVGGVAAYFAHVIIANAPHGINTPISTIVVVATPLEYGSTLTDENLTEVPWASSSIPEGSFTSKADLLKDGERAALSSMEKNEPVIRSRITGPNQPASLAALVEPGMRAIAVRVDEVRGVAGFVRKGDRVDVILTRSDSRNEPGSSFADVLLQNVKVLAIGQTSNERQDHATVVKTVTVEVTTQQAQKLVLAEGVGNLALVLRQAGAGDLEPARRISVADLGQGEFASAASLAKPVVAPTPKRAERADWVKIDFYHGAKTVNYPPVYSEAR
jgi:pilus assembly protein CpaB